MSGLPGPRLLGAAFAALGVGIGALVPIFLVAYPAAGIGPADAADPAVVLPVVASNRALFTGPAALEIVVHAIGAIALLGLWARFGATSFLLACATLAGLVWMTVDVIDNGVTFHVLPIVAAEHAAGSATAAAAFTQLSYLTDSIRLAGHVAGGLWMVGASAYAIRSRRLPAVISWTGLVVGAIFAGNLFVPTLLNLSFMTVPLWLVILGVGVGRTDAATSGEPIVQLGAA